MQMVAILEFGGHIGPHIPMSQAKMKHTEHSNLLFNVITMQPISDIFVSTIYTYIRQNMPIAYIQESEKWRPS